VTLSDYSKLSFFYNNFSETTYEGKMARQFVKTTDFPNLREEYVRAIEGQIRSEVDMEANIELRRRKE